MTISNSTFIGNEAISGACISIRCLIDSQCSNTISDNTFVNNSAVNQGGAVFYNMNRPVFSNNEYVNNSAPYGPEIASYAVKIVQRGTSSNNFKLSEVASGQVLEEPLQLDLIDYDSQVMSLDSQNTIKVSPKSQSAKVAGTDFAKLNQGSAEFDGLILSSSVGESNILFSLTTASIDSNKINQVLNNSNGEYDNQISADFRYCKPGEIEVSGQCSTCAYGTYSLNWNSTICESCMDHAICQGGDIIEVEPGYWRFTKNSTTIIE